MPEDSFNEIASYNWDGSRLLSSKYDNLFKQIITAGWCVKSDGNVEAPCGYFAFIEIPDHLHELAQMRDAVDETSSLVNDWPESGWYTSYENEQGLIFVFQWGSKEQAEAWYARQECTYSLWDAEGIEPIEKFAVTAYFDNDEDARTFEQSLAASHVRGLLSVSDVQEL